MGAYKIMERYILEEAIINMLDDYIVSAKEAGEGYIQENKLQEALSYQIKANAYKRIKEDIHNNAFKIYAPNKNTIK